MTGPGSSPSNGPDQENIMTEVFDIGDGDDGTPALDVCADCGHYRGEHDGTVCYCIILNARTRTSRQCDCEGFLDA